MILKNLGPPIPDDMIEDLRGDATKKPEPSGEADPKGDLNVPDKTLINEPSGDIGEEMQPAMRGYGKISKNLNKWRVR